MMGTFSVEVYTLLGAHALEGLGLAVDPARKVLEPSRFPLAAV
jgi:hypothetical protein